MKLEVTFRANKCVSARMTNFVHMNKSWLYYNVVSFMFILSELQLLLYTQKHSSHSTVSFGLQGIYGRNCKLMTNAREKM